MKINYLKLLLFITPLMFIGNIEEVSAQDWANLQRFSNENDSLLQLPSPSTRVVFMGNSITEGWIKSHPQFFNENSYLDRGISGQTTPQMLLRFKQDVVNLHPKAVVILGGTNDIAGNTGPSTLQMVLDNISSMAEVAKANGIIPILCSVLPAYDYPWKHGMEPNIKIPELNKMLKSYAEKNNILYVDYFNAMAEPNNAMKPEYTYDGVHCTSDGYDVMESLIVPAINKALKKKK